MNFKGSCECKLVVFATFSVFVPWDDISGFYLKLVFRINCWCGSKEEISYSSPLLGTCSLWESEPQLTPDLSDLTGSITNSCHRRGLCVCVCVCVCVVEKDRERLCVWIYVFCLIASLSVISMFAYLVPRQHLLGGVCVCFGFSCVCVCSLTTHVMD